MNSGSETMGKDLSVSVLLDFYKQLLTQKQSDALDLYYNQDLSLSEIAQHMGITRQGVRDNIKRGEKQLLSYEEELGLAGKFARVSALCDVVNRYLERLSEMNLPDSANEYLADIKYHMEQITDIV